MKIQFTFECFNKAIKKEDVINDCLNILIQETQKMLMGNMNLNQSPINAVFKDVQKQPIGFKQN